MLKKLLALGYLVVALGACQAQTPLSEEVKANIKLRVDNGMNAGIIVGLIDNKSESYFGYGVKSLDTMEAVDEYSIFEIGSISKTFTGILLADEVLKNEMKLEDPLQLYLPKGVTAPTQNGESIRLIHMANHTSSLPRMPSNFNPSNPANPFADYSEKQLYDFLGNYELPRKIGSQYEYSNYAMGLLGHILADKNESTYEELLIERITEPLGLNDTRISFTASMKKNLAMGHSGGVEVENWDIPTLAGAGAIRSSAVDMLDYLATNMGIKESNLYPAMQLAHQNSRKEGESPIVGLGWHTMVVDDLEIIWHNGGTGGYRTFAGFIKGGDRGVVVLSNSNTGVDDIGIHILHPDSPLNEIKPSIGVKLQNIMDTLGIEAAISNYWDLKKNKAEEFDFTEGQLSKLGHRYLKKKEMEKALAIFKLNIEAFPNSSNVYASYGKAQLKHGDKETSIINYKKAVELNPGNLEAIKNLTELGIDPKNIIEEIVVDEKILETYIGRYELYPNFILTVSKDRNQLKTQATGQPEFPIFPKSDNVFYLKVVEAQLTFNKNGDGKVESVTLLQAGQEITGKKLKK
ncbi:serine hydrolase [Ulvibacterium sp.]|uniref:serine hydrolase n=1 Tax=Ulvibacterium sp. TaxID=2665914 RepID=UPI003BAA9AE8